MSRRPTARIRVAASGELGFGTLPFIERRALARVFGSYVALVESDLWNGLIVTVPAITLTTPDAPSCSEDQELLGKKDWPKNSKRSPVLRIADLFAGAGGLSLGAFLAAKSLRRRFEVALAVEVNKDAAAIYASNFGDRLKSLRCLHEGDIGLLLNGGPGRPTTRKERQLVEQHADGEPIDLLMGGPPCQGHSDLNNHTRRDDPRNSLYAKMARAAQVLEPRVVIIENVRQVIHDRSGVVAHTEACLEKLGYVLRHHVVRLESLGVPQRRHRHVLVGVHQDYDATRRLEALEQLLRTPLPRRDVGWAIGDLAGVGTTSGKGFDEYAHQSPDNLRRLQWFAKNTDEWDLPDSERPPCHRNGGHSYKAVYGRLRTDQPANTLTTGYGSMGQGRYVHPTETRTITPHEAARLQTFPDFFRFDAVNKRTAWAKAIGNAVPPIGAREIIRSLLA